MLVVPPLIAISSLLLQRKSGPQNIPINHRIALMAVASINLALSVALWIGMSQHIGECRQAIGQFLADHAPQFHYSSDPAENSDPKAQEI
jgi:hypothetical protein